MSNKLAKHDIAWAAPQPFWTDPTGAVQPGSALRRPQILRFTHDEFIPELLALLQQSPAALPAHAAMAETWRGPCAVPPAEAESWLQGKPARILAARRRAQQGRSARTAPASTGLLKLYQPAHMRHYLVGGSLVCRTPGLPDRQIDPARQKVCYLIRRLLPRVPSTNRDEPLPDPRQTGAWDEFGFVPNGKTGAWRYIGPADAENLVATIAPAEERLALFPANFVQDDGHPRRLYIGNVPVGRREAYQGAGTQAPSSGSGAAAAASAALDPRLVLFHTQVLGPWKALVNRVMGNGQVGLGALSADPDNIGQLKSARLPSVFKKSSDPSGYDSTRPDVDTLRAQRSALQTSSWYLLLDLYNFLKDQLGLDVRSAAPTGTALALYNALDAAAMPDLGDGALGPLVEPDGAFQNDDVESNLIDALIRIVPFAASLEEVQGSFTIPPAGKALEDVGVQPGWPDFLFLFADPWLGVLRPPEQAAFDPPEGDYLVEKVQARIDALADLVAAALPAPDPARPAPEPTLASMQPADMREAWYVMRLVYERPGCAPFHEAVVSEATPPFQMAGFFDPDAPARPIRIGLPMDISPAGLRKFDKNAVFMMSDMLCGQVDRMKGIGLADLVLSVLPWPFHKPLSVPEKGDCKTGDGLSLGVMCSLSIPIITICALLLLMIIVSLLDFIFRWLPYFIVCFPLPGFKGRKK
ncbi:hypothetical protein [Roseateles sp. PN1]|uniref:hypothetical protein n=1 Tax=Roseateles sp. PN1 TaxID=3137372 RepID=UPI003139B1B3